LQEKKAAKSGPIVDDEGFTLVVAQKPHRSLKPASAAAEDNNTLDVNALNADAAAAAGAAGLGSVLVSAGTAEPKKKKKSTPLHFYRFQERQQKRDRKRCSPAFLVGRVLSADLSLLFATRTGSAALQVRRGQEACGEDETATQVQTLLACRCLRCSCTRRCQRFL
jgi:hypothetical protein